MYKFDHSRLVKVSNQTWDKLRETFSNLRINQEYNLIEVSEEAGIEVSSVLALLCCLNTDGMVKFRTAVYHCSTKRSELRKLKDGFPTSPWKCSLCGEVVPYEDLQYDLVFWLKQPVSI